MSPAFKHHALADIGELMQVLRDQYEASSIPKELIQNADDAGATSLHFTWASGWPDHPHPLLRAPALVVLNDGLFRDQDAEGIQYLRLGAKGGDSRTIGKFGLGLKSVFHLSDAFLYFASSSQPPAHGMPFGSSLNPWEESEYHRDWLGVEQYLETVQSWLGNWEHGHQQWFALWLPFRQRSCQPHVVNEFAQPDHFFSEQLPREICRAFPLLQCLKRVSVWKGGTRPVLDYSLGLNGPCERRRFPHLVGGQRHRISGVIGDGPNKATFIGHETLLDDPEFSAIQMDDAWPQTPTIDATGARFVRDKAAPHAAAVFLMSKANTRAGELRVSPAVFLALSEKGKAYDCDGGYDFELLLHGNYFIDAGRRRLADSVDELRTKWNAQLRTKGALRLVLSALRDLVSEVALDEGEATGLTKALERATSDDIGEVCHEAQWLFRVTASRRGWELLADGDYFDIPTPPANFRALPFEVFPRLERIAANQTVTWADRPRLSARTSRPWLLDDSQWFGEILAVNVKATFVSQQSLAYFIAFLELERDRSPKRWERSTRPVLAAIRNALAEVGLASLYTNHDQLRSLTNLLSADSFVAVPTAGADKQRQLDRLIEKLADVLTSQLVLPAALLSGGPSGKLSLADTCLLLKSLAGVSATTRQPTKPATADKTTDARTASETREARSDLALLFLSLTAAASRDQKRAACGEWAVFRAFSYRNQAEESVTWNALHELSERHRLFGASGGSPEALQEALRDDTIYRLVESGSLRASDVLLGAPAGTCTPAACLSVLNEKPALASADHRVALLRAVRETHNDDAQRRALRYLLHGHHEDLVVGQPLYALGTTFSESMWARLLNGALTQLSQGWRLLPEILTNELTPSVERALGVEAVEPAAVEKLVGGLEDLAWIAELQMSNQDREGILGAVTNPTLWKRLPLHEAASGELIAIDKQRSYLDSGIPVPAVLKSRVILLRSPDTPGLVAAYAHHGIGRWDALTALTESLGLERPLEAYGVILDALERLRLEQRALPHPLAKLVKEKAWLPTQGEPVAPKDVVCLPEVAGLVDRVRLDPVVAQLFVHATELLDVVRSHTTFEYLREAFFPNTLDAIAMLGQAMAQTVGYRLGVLKALGKSAEAIRPLTKCAQGAAEGVFGSEPILREIDRCYGAQALSSLATLLRHPVPIDVILARMGHLAARHGETPQDERETLVDVHRAHAQELAEHADFTVEALRGVKLINRRGRWQAASHLALDAPGISPSAVLHEGYAALFRGFVRRHAEREQQNYGHGGGVEHARLTGESFRPFWRSWDSVIAQEVIGGFIALFGDEPSIRDLAQEFLGQARDIDLVRARLDLRAAYPTAPPIPAPDRYVFDVTDPKTQDTIATVNLLGEPFDAALNQEVTSLLIDYPRTVNPPNEPQACLLRFRRIEPAEYTREELLALLLETARTLLLDLRWGVAQNLEALWSELSQTEQLDLKVAQSMILESGFFYLRQLAGKAIPTLKPIVTRWDALRYRREEERLAKEAGRAVPQTSDVDMRKLREELHGLLKTQDVQAELLTSIRSRIKGHYQYTLQSIPFELFQNADDAGVELTHLEPSVEGRGTRVVVEYDAETLWWAHWGRPINRYRSAWFSAEQGQSRGFDRDLEKMLILSSSDKESGEGEVTGKFGLGFKTVFLLDDRPLVLSDRIAFRVLAGIFPETVDSVEQEGLRVRSMTYGGESGGTLFELKAQVAGKPREALERFLKLVHITLAFARHVKHCDIRHPDGKADRLSWGDRPVGKASRLRLGTLSPSVVARVPPESALLLGGPTCRLLLAFGGSGFKAIPADTPTLWVTAPTDERLGVGFALNGPFALDVGRARVASSEVNDNLARAGGLELAEAFEELFLTADEWLARSGEVAEKRDSYHLWRGLWGLMTSVPFPSSESSAAARIVRIALWDRQLGYSRLLEDGEVLPSELGGEYRKLTSTKRACFVVRGLLVDEGVFGEVAAWSSLRDTVAPGEAIAPSVATALAQFASWTLHLQPLTLTQVIRWELRRGRRVSRENAARLGLVINSELTARVRREMPKGEDELADALKEFEFQAADGSWQPSQDLLIGTPVEGRREDEPKRAAFAPAKHVVHPEYNAPEALDFAEACRGTLRAPSDLLLQWGLGATETPRRVAFLRYLLEGELGRQVAGLARVRRSDTWLDTLPNDSILGSFADWQQLQLLGLLGFTREQISDGPGEQGPQQPILDPEIVLRWWRDEGHLQVPAYLQRLYPTGDRLALKHGDRREDWLRLFLLAIAQSVGRVQPEATRNFAKLCEERGWLAAMARAQEDPTAWLGAFDEHIDNQVERLPFQLWMRLLIGLFIVGRRLDEYVEALRSIDRWSGPFSPDQVFNPRASARLAGGGADAPPIAQVLGIGCCFLLRELTSGQAIANPVVHPFCYVPTKKVRWLVRQLGGPNLEDLPGPRWNQSAAIYEFLRSKLGPNDATFDGTFDLPLQLLAYDDRLLNRVLNLTPPAGPDLEEEDGL